MADGQRQTILSVIKMSVTLRLGNALWEVGSADFFNSFFSTITHHLAPQGLGTRYPAIENLYAGGLSAELARSARSELQDIRRELTQLSPDQVVWDSNDLARKPPWGVQHQL